jgi:outer membrane lipoprotein SlyB
MLKTVMLLLLGSLIAVSGCASSKSPSASVAAPADVNGTWTGSTSTGSRTVTLQLQQTGPNVTGTLAGAGGNLDGPITGIVDGNTIKLKERPGTGMTPWLNVKGDVITGDLGSGNIVTLRRAR